MYLEVKDLGLECNSGVKFLGLRIPRVTLGPRTCIIRSTASVLQQLLVAVHIALLLAAREPSRRVPNP